MADQKSTAMTSAEKNRTMLDALYTIAKRAAISRGMSPELALEDIAEFARATIMVAEHNA